MKTTKILLGALRISALIALFAVVPAQAQTVNVGFNSSYTGLGAASDSGTTWNNLTVTPPDYSSTYGFLVTSTGGTSTVTISLSDPDAIETYNGSPGANVAPGLLNQVLYANGGSDNPNSLGDFTVGGLTDGGKYNLYLYAVTGSLTGGRSTTFTVDSISQTVTNATNASSFIAGNNYVEFAGLTANGSGDISGTWGALGNTGPVINGFQIQSVPAVVPEPSSLATMSLVGMALLLFCKRLKKQSV